MAKTDNLKDFLTDVADAIREKKGTTDLINPQDFSAEIASIQSGGGTAAIPYNDVTFCDYDGTVLYSYSKNEFLALAELPTLPTRDGLICQGWNWELADAKEYVQKYGGLVVGANYTTDNGATRLYINTMQQDTVQLSLKKLVGDIDWGDGVRETVDIIVNTRISHKYSKSGKYIISIFPTSGSLRLFFDVGTEGVFGGTTSYYNQALLEKAEIGAYASIGYYSFLQCCALQSISIPRECATEFDNYDSGVFKGCNSLRFVVIPPGSTGIGQYAFVSCSTLRGVSFPKTSASISDEIFRYCYNLERIYFCDSVESIKSNMFSSNWSLRFFKVPSGVTSIGSSAFSSCGARYIDFSNHASVPSLSSTSAFSGFADMKIIVPDALYDEWIAATNWSSSSIVGKIIKKSDWDASQS